MCEGAPEAALQQRALLRDPRCDTHELRERQL